MVYATDCGSCYWFCSRHILLLIHELRVWHSNHILSILLLICILRGWHAPGLTCSVVNMLQGWHSPGLTCSGVEMLMIFFDEDVDAYEIETPLQYEGIFSHSIPMVIIDQFFTAGSAARIPKLSIFNIGTRRPQHNLLPVSKKNAIAFPISFILIIK